MALNYSLSVQLYKYYYILLIPLFFSPVLCSNVFDQTREILAAEKIRLGSTPPSCYNKCRQCHPCKAVQVATLPSLHRVEPPLTSHPPSSVASFEYESSYSGDNNNRYSNYKPLGWKCSCRDHYYNP